jgi:hypothetical protein
MDIKGVSYDVGRAYSDQFLTRLVFLGILDAGGVDGAFVWTFADPWLTHTADPRHDLDMTATSLVKTYARGHGTTYPDLPWEPKQAFGAVAGFYAAH